MSHENRKLGPAVWQGVEWTSRGRNQRVWGKVLGVFGLVAALAVPATDSFFALVSAAAAVASIVVGLILLIRGRRVGQRTANEMLDADHRPPVVFLRAFASDPRGVGDYLVNSRELLHDHFGFLTPDEMQMGFAAAMNRIGAFVALEQPGAALPGFGAARHSASNSEWQATIDRWIHEAALIVVWARLPASEGGFNWELDKLVKLERPGRLLLLCPARTAEYRRFKAVADRIFPTPLPEQPPESRMIAFHADWTPWPLLHFGPKGERGGWDLIGTLRPMLAENGVLLSPRD